MTRLKKGDICPLCGEPIMTSDPFTLGYLSAWADLTSSPETESHADDSGEDFPFAYAVPCGAAEPYNRGTYPKGKEKNEPLTLFDSIEMEDVGHGQTEVVTSP